MLSGFTVAIGSHFDRKDFDPRGFTKCITEPGQLTPGENRSLRCTLPVVGRYVTIYLLQKGHLTLCEAEVYQTDRG